METSEIQTTNKYPQASHNDCFSKTNSLTILVEPTSDCNLDCAYCYKGKKVSKSMSLDIVENMLKKVILYNNENDTYSSFVWHGGEPTMMGAKFYEDVFDSPICRKSKNPVGHTVQTNGTLLTNELLDVFANHKVSISVSLDGPPDYHNKLRPYKNGKPSYQKIITGIEKAKAKGIKVGILMSISNDNLEHINDMFEYCRTNNFTFGINPISADLHSLHEKIEVTPENYLNACIKIFDLWFYQKDFSIQVNPGFGIARHLLSKGQLSDCINSENCQMHFISIGPEGDIYPCNRFYGIDDFLLGNIVRDNLNNVLNCRRRIEYINRNASKIKECTTCSISKYCNGGCMHHAIVHYGSIYSPDHLCIVYRGLVEHAVKRIHQNLIN